MRFNYFLGVDPGLIHDPTGMVLIRATRPAVVVRDGKVIDAATGAAVIIPKGVTVAEYVAPRYAVTDVQSIKGMTFDQAAREARAIMVDLGGLMVVCDATGLGVGAVDAIRKAGVPTIAVTLTGGSKVTGSRWAVNLPVSLMFASMYSIMAQDRLRVTSPAGEKLIAELKDIERRISDQGRESYDVATGEGHHGDTVYAAAMALIIAERRVGGQSRSMALQAGGHQRKPGAPRQGNTARAVIKERLERSRLESERSLWAQIEEPKPFT